ncbi:sigma factor SigF [Cyanobium gracile UHCC 0139]|uniref:Sigma factor SigF n=1 Tax=Cyanobium gracile UHCC 0139 TaxID=3110308 RepID=A0ABU5RS24_9CYAN|nr:sigma factor SigF [Cyanobium gracile]MEA5390575.1 sigma factor SigF [Cyanobium gracile UHCC 0139]
MIPPFGYCSGSESGASALRRYQERKLRLLSFWRDGIERQLAAMNAAISTLEQQMHRDQADHPG